MAAGSHSVEPVPPSAPPALVAAAEYLRRHWLRFAVISAVVLTPCFWQRRIQAGDLASHVYNAWLAQLVAHGQVPGLWIARQWNNVLFDVTLSALGNAFGLAVAQRIAVAGAVLIFFWGAFALVSAASRRTAWSVAPCLAVVAYGWTFQMGFLNYYLSLGFAFFALALLWRGRAGERAAVLLLVPPMWLAHPLGVVLLVCAGAWIVLGQTVPARAQWAAGLAAVAALLGVHFYIRGRYPVFGSAAPRYFFNGADQLLLYGPRYRWPAALWAALIVASVVAEAIGRRSAVRWDSWLLPAQLYCLAFLTILLMPAGIILPQYAAPAGFLHERLSCICAVFACCLLATVQPRKWQCAGFATVAVIFFWLLYVDTARVNRMEDQAEFLERSAPAGQRVLATIEPPAGSRVAIFHIADRACIGYCFSFGNYEPGSGQFRLRAAPNNPFVSASFATSLQIERGQYIVQPRDVPIFQVYPCQAGSAGLCLRKLAAGDRNGLPWAQAGR